MRYVLPLKRADDPANTGVKAYVLGKLYREGFPVPDGFVINNRAYRIFLVQNDIEGKIIDLYNSADLSRYESIVKLSQDIKDLMMSASVPEEVEEEIVQAYKFMNIGEVAPVETIDILRAGREQYRVVMRPSVDSKFNFPGLFPTSKAHGHKDVVEKTKEMWAGLHSPGAILYRAKLHINHDMDMCVLVQRQVGMEKGGVTITSKQLIIESTMGPNRLILSSEANPDRFIIQDGNIISRHLGKGSVRISLSDSEILKISSLVRRIEAFLRNKVITEWSIDSNKLYLLQCRSHNYNVELPQANDSLIKGLPVSPGYASGKIRLSYDGSKDIIAMENPPAPVCIMSSAIISEKGSYGSSKALMCRELGIPAMFGAENATGLISDGQKAVLDCYEGALHVFENDRELKSEPLPKNEKGFWIDTPAAALSLKKTGKDDFIFFDIEKVARLMFGSDYSEELMAHESVIGMVRGLCDKSDNVFVFWRREPEAYMASKLKGLSLRNVTHVSSKNIV